MEGGGSGLVAVEEYSDEWLPRPVTLTEREEITALASAAPSRARGWVWLFALPYLTGKIDPEGKKELTLAIMRLRTFYAENDVRDFLKEFASVVQSRLGP